MRCFVNQKFRTTDQSCQDIIDYLFSCKSDAQGCNDVGREEDGEGRETEAHVCPKFFKSLKNTQEYLKRCDG